MARRMELGEVAGATAAVKRGNPRIEKKRLSVICPNMVQRLFFDIRRISSRRRKAPRVRNVGGEWREEPTPCPKA